MKKFYLKMVVSSKSKRIFSKNEIEKSSCHWSGIKNFIRIYFEVVFGEKNNDVGDFSFLTILDIDDDEIFKNLDWS